MPVCEGYPVYPLIFDASFLLVYIRYKKGGNNGSIISDRVYNG